MKKIVLLIIFCITGITGFAQMNITEAGQLAPGALENFQKLLNKPAFVQPTKASALGKNWFAMETDAHVFTDEVNVRQIAAVLLDLDNQTKYFQGKKNKLNAAVVQRNADGAVVDFVSITPALGLQIKTPYRASVKTIEKSDTIVFVEIKQIEADSASNNSIKNLLTLRYAQTVTVNGKIYTYIRFYVYDEVNASILPGARGILESSSDAANTEALQLLIEAAKTK